MTKLQANRAIHALSSRALSILPYLLLAACSSALAQGNPRTVNKVIAPPAAFFELVRERDREAARLFYRKHVDIQGIPVVASEDVADRALSRTQEIVSHLLAGRPDIVQTMIQQGMYLIIIGKDQVYTDMPEYRRAPNPAFQNERVRGTGGKPTSFGEENLLSLPLDRYDDESIAVHEFCHTIDAALRDLDPTWTARRNATYDKARQKGLYHRAYAASNPGEYWAEICQAYFDTNRVNNWNHGPVGTRQQLRAYDPDGYELVRTTFRLSPDQDWRYKFAQQLPTVTAPPDKLGLDPYYTRFTWAREFTVIGRGASDRSLLKANDTIRKLCAYRHDILKALIAQGVKLVVLGRDERIADLPEYRALADKSAVDALARSLDYSPELNLLVAGEENVLADARQPLLGDDQVVRSLASAIYVVLGSRPVDDSWDQRPRNVWQQYELGLKRLDARFGREVAELHAQAVSSGKWKGTAAIHDPHHYWVAAVLAYFHATGEQPAPSNSQAPIDTREKLQAYDPKIYGLVHEIFAYGGRVDWQLRP